MEEFELGGKVYVNIETARIIGIDWNHLKGYSYLIEHISNGVRFESWVGGDSLKEKPDDIDPPDNVFLLKRKPQTT